MCPRSRPPAGWHDEQPLSRHVVCGFGQETSQIPHEPRIRTPIRGSVNESIPLQRLRAVRQRHQFGHWAATDCHSKPFSCFNATQHATHVVPKLTRRYITTHIFIVAVLLRHGNPPHRQSREDAFGVRIVGTRVHQADFELRSNLCPVPQCEHHETSRPCAEVRAELFDRSAMWLCRPIQPAPPR